MSRTSSGLAVLALVVAGCVDLNVPDLNAPDAAGALATPEAVESDIAGAFRSWFNSRFDGDTTGAGGVYGYFGPALALSTASFQHDSPWANAGMRYFSQVPRQAIRNQAGDAYAPYLFEAWFASYRAISAVREGLAVLEAGRVDLGEAGNLRARAFGRYVQGLAHGTLALLYDSAFVYDETMSVGDLELQGYQAVMDSALRYLADAAELAESGRFTIPATWMSNETSSAELARLAHSWRARLRASVARTPAERLAVDWSAVGADVAAGLTEDWNLITDGVTFYDEAFGYGHYSRWAPMAYWIHGMADQSGEYQTWFDIPNSEKCARSDWCAKFLVITPDTRFPQGNSGAEQAAHPGRYYQFVPVTICLDAQYCGPGTYRNAGWDWWVDAGGRGPIALVTVREMRLLLAEAAYRRGDLDQVAAIVNETRTLHGLNATDAAGTNASCVPKLPNGQCGDLWEMLKWEKRLETEWLGPLRAGWYFDGRGWGDLMEGTFLQIPVPYSEMLIMGKQPYDFGGVGGPWAAHTGLYGY